jgi:drug/metabolite transporter (DMT)-like permease
VISVLAAVCFACSSALKHLSVRHAPDATQLSPRAVSRLILFTATHRVWLVGLGCDAGGVALQMLALHFGRLSVVQPVLVSALLFAIVIRAAFDRRRPTRGELMWAVLLAAALAAFVGLTAARATSAERVNRLPAVIAAVAAAAAVLAVLTVGRTRTHAQTTAALFGVAVGVIYAGTAALLKEVSDILARSPMDVLLSWQLYAVIVLGIGGVILTQVGFRAGPITASLAATTVVDPLVAILLGVAVFGEEIGAGPARATVLAILLIALVISTVQLARQPGVASVHASEPQVPTPDHTGSLRG